MAEGSGQEADIRFESIATGSDHVFGRATLTATQTLNALTLDMVDRLGDQMEAWAHDPKVAGVIIDSSSDKAFCAGGDVVALYKAMRSAEGRVPAYAAEFFEHEYRLDFRIHTYPKPVLCWGHGIVMGGGVGLFAGASHRVATTRTKFAMPEITIGLYPDVGASWFLAHMRARTGLFLALTGAPLNAADLRYAGLADYTVEHALQKEAYGAIAAARWSGCADVDHAALSHLLDRSPEPSGAAVSGLQAHADLIDRTMGNDDLADVAVRLDALVEHEDPWLATAARTFAKGSPTSAMLALLMQEKARHLSLADVFRLEYLASVGCAMGHDFPEGVRALLLDKDKNPRWSPASLKDVRRADIEKHLAPQFAGEHPLEDLH